MKSKTVASIMRHVASKTSHIGADGEEPSKEVAEEHEEKTKRNRRAKRMAMMKTVLLLKMVLLVLRTKRRG